MCSRICDSLPPSLPPSLLPSHMQVCLRGLLCTRCGLVEAALEHLSGFASALPVWAVLCYAVLCLLALARKGASVATIFGGSIKTLAGS